VLPGQSFLLRIVFAVGFLGFLLAIGFIYVVRQPLLAYHDRHLIVRLEFGEPDRVPIELVECFLLGQGPSWLPGKKYAKTQTVTLVIRLAERAVDWSHRFTHPMLGSWCDGYITIRGTWCEPLSLEVVNRLNRRLDEAHRAAAPVEKVAG
ncbi:MAG: hypothetical protein WD176_08600, partial [Pirellulales bacterium]